MKCLVAIAVLWLLIAGTAPAWSQAGGTRQQVYSESSRWRKNNTLYHKPVYHPATKSYFELVRLWPENWIEAHRKYDVNWETAYKLARARIHKGVRGRLAIVKSRKTNDFLRKTFRPTYQPWIGLRYWCGYNKIQWVDGSVISRRDYSNWDRVWNRVGGYNSQSTHNCGSQSKGTYYPVHYWTPNQGFRWNANTKLKEFGTFFVEYPTGKP